MQLITDEYRSLNQKLHVDSRVYGKNGVRYLDDVIRIATELKTQDILDYGCGKSTLSHSLPFRIKQYDPAIPKYSGLPTPADVVICTDVLEHVEPECLDNVLNHLKTLVKRAGFFAVGMIPAKKTLEDGRNAYLVIQKERWWILKLLERFELSYMNSNEQAAIFVVRPKEI